MSKITLTEVGNLRNETTGVQAINDNFDTIVEAIDNTLSRDGTSPNSMDSDLDMDSNRIYNLPEPTTDSEAATKSYVDDAIGSVAVADASIIVPSTTVDNAIATWNGTTGTYLQDSGVVISDSAVLSGLDSIELDHASDTTIARASAGRISVEGSNVLMASDIPTTLRIKQTAATSYYVRTDGNDNNTGLANTSAGAFRTIQGALDYLGKNVDFARYTTSLNVGAGTFAGFSVSHPWVGDTFPHIIGAGSGSTIIEASADNETLITARDLVVIGLNGLTLSAGGHSGVVGIDASQYSVVDLDSDIKINTMSVAIKVQTCAVVNAATALTFAGNLDQAVQAFNSGIFTISSAVVNGGLTITYFLNVQQNSLVTTFGSAATFSGAGAGAGTTGTKYITSSGGRIADSGTTWPGATAGTLSQVDGPSAAVTDNAIVRWDTTSGNAVQGSGATINDSGVITSAGLTTTGSLITGSDATDKVTVKGIYMNPSAIAVAVPSIANDAAENVDSVAVDVSASFSMQPAVGDAVVAIPLEALPTDCLLCGCYVTNTDQITVTFGSKEGGGGVTGANKNFKFLVFDLT